MAGGLLGVLYHWKPDYFGPLAFGVAREHSPPLSINLLGIIGIVVLGVRVAAFGRVVNSDNWLARTIQFGALELAVAYSAIFCSLLAGFTVMNLSKASAAATLAASALVYVMFVVIPVAGMAISHRGVGTWKEGTTRIFAGLCVVLLPPLLYWYPIT